MRPRAAHEVPLLTLTASHVIEMEDTVMASGSSGTPFALERSPLDFANEDPPQMITKMEVIQEPGLEKEVAVMGPPVNKRHRKRGNDEAEANAPPKVLRKDHAAFRPAQSTLGGKSLASIGLETGSTFVTPATQETPTNAKSVSEPKLLTYANHNRIPSETLPSKKIAPKILTENVATIESLGSGKSTFIPSMDGSPGGIYQPGWGVTNNCHLDTPDACQDVVDHTVPPGYFSELRHLPNTDFLSQYNINLTQQVAMGSQLRLRFEQEVRLLKKATAKIARRDQRIQAREEEIKKLDEEIKSLRTVEAKVHGLHNRIKNLETLLEAEADMKKAAEAKNAELAKELEILRVQFSDLQVSNNQLSQQMDARLDKLRQVFDDVVSAGLVKGMSEGLKHGIKHGKASRDLAAVEAYDPEADNKYVKALQDLKDLKYLLVDQLEKLKDAPMELLMASLYLNSDSEEDAPQ
ncbi:hypothetical protein Tco_1087311 [Tanacetum coccineum]